MSKPNKTRKVHNKKIKKRFNEQPISSNEIARLKRKLIIYQKQESALMKMLDIVRDQMTKIEVEGLQIAANNRQKDEEKELDHDTKDNNVEMSPQRYFENIDEINKAELMLGDSLEQLLSNACYTETEEDEDLANLSYFQGYE